jgi:flagellar basal-body rod protein FlgG
MYAAAAGMAAGQQRLDALANDMANVNTTGYKRLRVAFRDLVYTQAGLGAAQGVEEGSGSAARTVGRTAAQGALQRTDRRLDVAVTGPGYIQVRRADGQLALTRDGALRVDENGRLGTSDGALLVPGIQLPRGTSEEDVNIQPDGRVLVQDRVVGQIRLVSVRAADGLRSIGDNLFQVTAQSGAAAAAGAGTRVEQGALEASNVDLADLMTDMIAAQRSFQMASKAITTQDQLAEIANGVKR